MIEITTVADDEVVLFDGPTVTRFDELAPDTEHELGGVSVRTLPRPDGELLCRFATVNDVHFGETECGVMEGFELGPVFAADEGADPYPETMNRGAIAEMRAIDPAVVLVKGDLTDRGVKEEYDAFLAAYGSAFGDRLQHIRGNHDAFQGEPFADNAPFILDLPGVRLAAIDTVIPRQHTGQVTAEQIEWLDSVAAESDRPVLVFGHHHAWSPESRSREPGYFGINPDDSDRLVDVVARRPSIRGYFAGHTHRNRVRRFNATGDVPWVEVACVKDFPGAWAEYRVFDGGILQIHRRISTPEALAWTEKTRGMFGGLYPDYAFGQLNDRCFAISRR
ncbi:MAG: 3,5-cyclic-AMP phosphodiesterase [Acidimicrobiaceae bacterium]|jgi:predicted phosphodiesterase|nr:3,5-cyclic-AMP phosphodiesterase [Acidimicrobiaceae bacterium]